MCVAGGVGPSSYPRGIYTVFWKGLFGTGRLPCGCAGIVTMSRGVQGACVYSLHYRVFLGLGKCPGKDGLCIFPI